MCLTIFLRWIFCMRLTRLFYWVSTNFTSIIYEVLGRYPLFGYHKTKCIFPLCILWRVLRKYTNLFCCSYQRRWKLNWGSKFASLYWVCLFFNNRDFLSEELPQQLPQRRKVDHQIELVPEQSHLPWRLIVWSEKNTALHNPLSLSLDTLLIMVK